MNKKTKVSGEFPDIFLTLNTHQYIEKNFFFRYSNPKNHNIMKLVDQHVVPPHPKHPTHLFFKQIIR